MEAQPLPRRLVRLVGFVVTRVLVEPVREGRLRDAPGTPAQWPNGLHGVVYAALGCYLLAGVTILAAPMLRLRTNLLVTQPDQTVPFTIFALTLLLVSVALAALFTAALHVRWWWLRVLLWVVVSATLVRPLYLDQVFATGAGPVHATVWVTLAVPALLALLLVLRWRSAFAAWEFPVVLLLVGHAVVAGVAAQPVVVAQGGMDERVNRLSVLLAMMWPLAIPATVLAGAALVELSVSTAAWTATGFAGLLRNRRGARWWAGGLLTVVACWEFGWLWNQWRSGELSATALVGGAALAIGVLPAIALAGWTADRHAGDLDLRADPDDVPAAWRRFSPWLGLLIGATGGLGMLVAGILGAFGLPGPERLVRTLQPQLDLPTTLIAVLVAGLLALRSARRGLRLTAMGLAGFAAAHAVLEVLGQLGQPAAAEGVMVALSTASLLVLLWLLLRRRLDQVRLIALATALLMTALWNHREWLDDPITRLLSLSGVSAALLAGLLWKVLTDHAWTRTPGPRVPIPARVLLALANAVFGVTMALMLAGHGGHYQLRLDGLEAIGQGLLGTTLVLLTGFVALSLALSGGGRRYTQGEQQLH
ncbi:hypothetical protein [Enemella dayhoffiae]|uniref:hypothetical protein n=1 Tax=Enemella dayhoffiae TaxID=2016507 RepID=UPI000B973948|nr:hypothetical protein [Enemella dayhoffiae]